MFVGFLQPRYPSKSTPISPVRRRKLLLSYAPDWILTLLLAALFLSLDKVDGYRRVFSLADTSLLHPFAVHERVPDYLLYIIAGITPLVLMPIINWFTVRSWWDLHNSWLGLILGLALTGSVTQFVKITVGRPRPDVVDRCQPPAGSVDPPFGLADWTICTQTDISMLRDGFRSFPSGHSSMSFAGLGFLAYYLAGKLHLFDRRGHAGKAWISLMPFCGAALVAISRSMDYRHHWHDILVGSILGTVLSYFSYRQYYPSLTSEFSHRPFSPRIKDLDAAGVSAGNDTILPLHHEEGVATSGYNKPPGGLPSNNRYNSSPSPPLSHKHHGSYGYVSPNPFAQEQGGETSGYAEAEYELEGTVPRPGQGSLQDTWKVNAGGVDGTVPRSSHENIDHEDDSDGRDEGKRHQPQNSRSGLL